MERNGYLEIQDFYVRLGYRHEGHGLELANQLKRLATTCLVLPLKMFVAFADIGPNNIDGLKAIAGCLGLSLQTSRVRWAALEAVPVEEVPDLGKPLVLPRIPSKPTRPS